LRRGTPGGDVERQKEKLLPTPGRRALRGFTNTSNEIGQNRHAFRKLRKL
jgi:hypothetical protein